MRVLHVIDGLGPGGAETLLYRLVGTDSGVDHVVASLGRPDWYSRYIEERGVPVHHLGKLSGWSMPSAVMALRRLIKQTRPDVVQGWLYRSNILAGFAAWTAGVPRVWGIHCASLSPFNAAIRLFVRSTGIAARFIPNYIINCSQRSAELHAGFGYSKAPSIVIHNGYDSLEFFADEEEGRRVRKELGISADTFLIGCISRWNVFKDIPNLIAAVATACTSGIRLKCLLIGNGLNDRNAELTEAIRSSGCADAFLLLGRRTDVASLARSMDLHVLPSASEAFPNTVAETMLSTVPNVVTDVGDCALMVGDSGWVIRPGEPARLAEAIVAAWREWKEAPEAWDRRRTAARDRIETNFSFERMINAYETVWRQVSGHDPH